MSSLAITGLYVPGNRPDRFDKAVATGTQLVILDLEDAVPREAKADARRAVVGWLTERPTTEHPRIQVRVNPVDETDLEALRPLADRFTLRLPKVDGAADLDALRGFNGIVALIETALGVEHAFEIASHPLVGGLALGDSDLASEIGSASEQVLDYARLRLVFAARAAGLPAPMASAWPGIRDLDGLRADTMRARQLGMVGRIAIHPSQLPVIADSFRPAPEEITWATAALAAGVSGGVTTLSSGDMVDAAMLGRARRILDLAEATTRAN